MVITPKTVKAGVCLTTMQERVRLSPSATRNCRQTLVDGTGFYLSIGELRLFSGLQVFLRELPGRPVLGARRLRRLVVADDLLGGRVETQLAATGKRGRGFFLA